MQRKIQLRFAILIVILFLLPGLNAFFDEAPTLAGSFDFIFQIQKIYVMLAVFFLVFLYLGHDKLVKIKPSVNWLIMLGLGLFVVIAYLQIPFFDALQLGLVRVGGAISYDKVPFIGSSFYRGEFELENVSVMRLVELDRIPDNPKIKWWGYWADDGSGKLNDELQVFVRVNNKTYDVSKFDFPAWQIKLMEFEVNKSDLVVGENKIVFWAQNSGYDRVFLINHIYHYENALVDKGEGWQYADGMVLAYIEENVSYSRLQVFVFNYKPLFVLLAAMLLFIGLFGLKFAGKCMGLWPEAVAAAFATLGFAFGTALIKQNWRPIAELVVSLVAKICSLFFSIVVDVKNPGCPFLRVNNFDLLVCASSSGVESIGYFTLLFLLILVTNWKKVDRLKTVGLYAVGLMGTVVVNVFRIFSLVLVGLYISPEFARGTFHTNIGWILFLGYSAAYWFCLLPYVKKR
ncbi:MAG: archaeosortase/exosortase family protein [Candidatus Woesearchaeota archaeon]